MGQSKLGVGLIWRVTRPKALLMLLFWTWGAIGGDMASYGGQNKLKSLSI